ncbi:PEP-CTERM sorting domain-containing protein [Pirellulales bacterium]|nr:PEP-CTERM sorting domain-containing protein [Pirellulales bacterium]
MQNVFIRVAAVAAVAVTLVFASSAHAGDVAYQQLQIGESVVLRDVLVNGGTIPGLIVGDKMFDGFIYSATGDMPLANDVNVVAIEVDGNFGISFQGAFLDFVDQDGPQNASDAGIRFAVGVTPEAIERGYRISDAHLFGSGFGDFSLAGPGAFISVDENFAGNTPSATENGQSAGMTVFASNSGQGGTRSEDWVFFDSLYTRLRVQKDIVAFSSEEGQLPARMTIIDQTFSQVVIPEPASIALFGLGMIGIIAGCRRSGSAIA